jgi:hypothetical protein
VPEHRAHVDLIVVAKRRARADVHVHPQFVARAEHDAVFEDAAGANVVAVAELDVSADNRAGMDLIRHRLLLR